MQITEVKNYDEMSKKASEIIMKRIQDLPKPVLGLATGSTPEGMYKELVQVYVDGKISFSNTTTYNLDEYIGLPREDKNSYRFYMNDRLFSHVDISKEQTNVPNGMAKDLKEECNDYEESIKKSGGIDVQVLGIGVNGHIGFNEPGTSFQTATHVVNLAPSTIQANARFFESEKDVPKQAITMGIQSIMKSKEILLLISGAKKADAVYQLLHGEVSEVFPASILQQHPNVHLIADEAALSKVKENGMRSLR
ncbi:glucosamine-6-phosphate deaminase [Radiobacillus kanasensis]|uniref:glucosamine-6-phosphate deaminase n=1 Tax=Radiobacillus kanasensis TaxID=2844358 RepID=UPI001E336DA8|nr:glucosamine-6-phosphate deaminase [Radiobacillus kanasensis]UFT98563.1 glucosamine-6-phosphate deaminase [Radiobacillus kanasensis]